MRLEYYTLPLLAFVVFVGAVSTNLVSEGVFEGGRLARTAQQTPAFNTDPFASAVSAQGAAAALSSVVGNTDLVAFWSFDESAGVTLLDASNQENNGLLMSGPTWFLSGEGTALFFDGHDDYVVIDDSSSLHLTNAFTISAWVRPEVLNVNPILNKNGYEEEAYGSYTLSLEGSTLTYSLDKDEQLEVNDPAIKSNRWVHVAVVYDGVASPNTRLYVNGARKLSGSVSSPDINNAVLLLGRDSKNYTRGDIDNVRLYKRALSDSEIATLYGVEWTEKKNGVMANYEYVAAAGRALPDSSSANPFTAILKRAADVVGF